MNNCKKIITIAAIIVVIIVAPSIIFKYVNVQDMVALKTPDLNDNRWKTRESDYNGIKFTYIYMPGQKLSIEDCLQYRSFKNKRDAKKVYELYKDNNYNVLEEADTYFIGWENDVCDAAIKQIVCINGNIIITSEIYTASEWATTEDDTDPSYYEYPERLQYVLEHYVH